MNALRSPLHRTVLVAVVALGALALAGCAEKVTNVDAGFTTPEGRPDANARLVVYPDVPIVVETFRDILPDGPDTGDQLQGTELRYLARGAMHGVILDGTPATGYQVLRREANGGFAQAKDYTLSPVARFFDSQWELYAFTDGSPSGFSPPSYVGRGVVSGVVTPLSPLTNVGQVAAPDVGNLVYTAFPFPADSNITLTWNEVPGAAGYWIQIYQFMGGTQEKLLSARPAPFVSSDARNFFVGYLPAPASSYTLNQPGALVLFRRGLLMKSEYIVRISAVNDQGQLIAFTYGDYGYLRSTGSYLRYRLGGVVVTPTPQDG
jgi:hypothetical protein